MSLFHTLKVLDKRSLKQLKYLIGYIRKELTVTIQGLADDNQKKGEQINSLIVANKEMLAEKINEKYKIITNGLFSCFE